MCLGRTRTEVSSRRPRTKGYVMQASTTKFITTAALAAALIATLAGCGTQSEFLTAPAPSVSAPAESEVTEAPADPTSIEGLTAGDTLTDEQARALRRDFSSRNKAFELADGTVILISRDASLPENVKAQVGGDVKAASEAGSVYNQGIRAALDNAWYETGRKVIAVTQFEMANGPGTNGPVWTASSGQNRANPYGSQAEALAAAQAYVAAQPDAAMWDIVMG